ILLNLVVNARDAMPSGGILQVRTANLAEELPADGQDAPVLTSSSPQAAKHVLLEVTDTGCGMTAEVKGRIFEPFFTTKEPGKGTGLGLATVGGIVQQYGGRIRVSSEVGKGTTFQICFPRICLEAEAPAPAEKAEARLASGSGQLLLVEDELQV